MSNITIFGKGNMGNAIGENFAAAGNSVQYITEKDPVETIGDIVILAVPYTAAVEIAKKEKSNLEGKVVVDITNPLNFETWDELVVPSDSSAAAQISELLPDSKVVKAFNTTFAGTLSSKVVGTDTKTTVLMASDHDDAKTDISHALNGSGLNVVDAGSLKRAREMEALGFLQMTLAASEKIGWNGGFGVIK